MTTEDILEVLIQEGMKAYKKLNRNTPTGRKLSRKEPVEIEGITFSCWREYAVYKTAEYLKDLMPAVSLTVELDGNDTVIQLEVTSDEQREINRRLYSFLKKQNLV